MADASPPPPAYDDEKKVYHGHSPDIESAVPSGRARWFGGPTVAVGGRIAPVLSSTISNTSASDSDDNSSAILHKQREAEANATIKYRTCSWQKVRAIPKKTPSLGASLVEWGLASGTLSRCRLTWHIDGCIAFL